MHRFAVAFRKNMLRKLELALSQDSFGNRPAWLGEHKQCRLSLQRCPITDESFDLLVGSSEIRGSRCVIGVVHVLRPLELRGAEPAISAVFEPHVEPKVLHGDDFEFVFWIRAKEDLGCVVVLLKHRCLWRLYYRKIR